MACLNANSLSNHIDEIRIFMSVNSNVDVLAINETKIDDMISDQEVNIPGYEIIRKDRKRGGGVCIYVKSNINYTIRDDLNHEKLECITLEITKPRSRPFLVCTWYRRPEARVETFAHFEELVSKFDALGLENYILSDTNCDQLRRPLDFPSRKLRNITDVYGISQLVTKPTRITPISKTLID
ncbi:predicted protein [Nematostella vectensis]|uniref:Uncharacterized protein n=1 Tax=Nematostella vectensis TaxID=45351 RepID=A7S921_NEMVE|nr:predicted protein [Nematostella vectensis]|eukprot:XP_001631844.1 predicted protein [Nematostella vectensis]